MSKIDNSSQVHVEPDPFQTFLQSIPVRGVRKPHKPKPQVSAAGKLRYQQAHELNFNKVAHAAGHYFAPKMPDTNKSNGLTQAIINFIIWQGYRATRITSAGRMIGKRYIPGTTRKGAADISATVKGRSIMWEVKVGKDKPSPEQLREQELERKAGGEYYFVHTFDEFLTQYDSVI